MARDVESGQRRERERPAVDEDDSAYASSSRGSSDGEAPGGRRGASAKTAEASAAAVAVPSTTAAPPLSSTSTFSAALLRWFASSSAAGPPPAPPPAKLYDPLESSACVSIIFDDDDGDDGEDDENADEEAGGETVAAVKRRLGAAAAAAREDLLRSKRRRRLLLSSASFFFAASALAVALSSPWWLSAALLKPPGTHELPFVFVEGSAVSTASSASMPPSSRSSSSSVSLSPSPGEIVPRIIHQIWKSHSTPAKWDAARKSCADLHPKERAWTTRLWDDVELREAVAEAALRLAGPGASSLDSSPVAKALLSAYDSYPNPVQRADISRYAVLYLHGGVYLDLDVQCERRLDTPELALLEKEIVLPRTWPTGISNDVIIAAPGSGLLELALRSAATAKKVTSLLLFPSGYGRVMFSTGPMFLTIASLRWRERPEKLWVMPAKLYGKYREKNKAKAKKKDDDDDEEEEKKKNVSGGKSAATAAVAAPAGCDDSSTGSGSGAKKSGSNRLHGAGAACGALFTHLHGSSWHGKDAELLAWVRGKREGGGGGGSGGAAAGAGVLAATAASAAATASVAVVVARRTRTKQRRQQEQQQEQQLLQMRQRRTPASQKQLKQRPLGLFAKTRPLVAAAATPSLSKQH